MLLLQRVTTNLVQNSPGILSAAHRLLPNRVQNYLVLQQVNRLAEDFIDSGDLDFMDNKIAQIEIRDAGIRWYLTKQRKRLVMLDKPFIQADVIFSAEVNALVLMASQKVDPDMLFFNRRLQVTGDTELGLEIKNLIDQFDLNNLDRPIQKLLTYWAEKIA